MNRVHLKTLVFLIGFATVASFHMVENDDSDYSDFTDSYDGYEDDDFFGPDDYDEFGNSKFHCIWYGDCGCSNATGKIIPCVYNGPAKQVKNLSHVKALQIYCGHVLNHTSPRKTRTCCSHSQMISLNIELTAMESLLERCPSCWANMKKLYCDMTCSPHQSKFIKVTKSETFLTENTSPESPSLKVPCSAK